MKFIQHPAFILRVVIALAYIGMGIALLANKQALFLLSGGIKYAFAALLISYGSFRLYRAWTLFQNDEL